MNTEAAPMTYRLTRDETEWLDAPLGPKPPLRYVVAGWRTNHEDDPPLTRECRNPLAAAAAVRSLLDVGYVHILVEAMGPDGKVAYPDF